MRVQVKRSSPRHLGKRSGPTAGRAYAARATVAAVVALTVIGCGGGGTTQSTTQQRAASVGQPVRITRNQGIARASVAFQPLPGDYRPTVSAARAVATAKRVGKVVSSQAFARVKIRPLLGLFNDHNARPVNRKLTSGGLPAWRIIINGLCLPRGPGQPLSQCPVGQDNIFVSAVTGRVLGQYFEGSGKIITVPAPSDQASPSASDRYG
jgi:hypothetical protein